MLMFVTLELVVLPEVRQMQILHSEYISNQPLITRATCGRPSLGLPFRQSFYLSIMLRLGKLPRSPCV